MENFNSEIKNAFENLTKSDRMALRSIVSKKGKISEDGLENITGGVNLSGYGQKALKWIEENYKKVLPAAGTVLFLIPTAVMAYIFRDEVAECFRGNNCDDSFFDDRVEDVHDVMTDYGEA